jgi:hypothetical protein
MARKTQLMKRLGKDLAVATEAGRVIYRHADGSKLALPQMADVDVFLAYMADGPASPLPFSPDAIAFLAACEITGSMSDVEASLIERARAEVAGTPAPEPPAPTIRERVERLVVRMEAMQAKAPSAAVSRETRACLATLADLQDAPATFDLLRHPAYVELRSRLMEALAEYPDARLAVAAALEPDSGIRRPLRSIPPAIAPYRPIEDEDPLL